MFIYFSDSWEKAEHIRETEHFSLSTQFFIFLKGKKNFTWTNNLPIVDQIIHLSEWGTSTICNINSIAFSKFYTFYSKHKINLKKKN